MNEEKEWSVWHVEIDGQPWCDCWLPARERLAILFASLARKVPIGCSHGAETPELAQSEAEAHADLARSHGVNAVAVAGHCDGSFRRYETHWGGAKQPSAPSTSPP